MFGLKKLLNRDSAPEHLPADVREALAAWRRCPAPALDEVHFHTRYVVVDIASSGLDPENDRLFAIAAGALRRSIIQPDDALFCDLLAAGEDAATVDRLLMAFLRYAAKAPLVTYHVPYVGGFLQRAYRERLGVDFRPQWVDLAWLLPAMFEEKNHSVQPLDHWARLLGLGGGSGRRGAMENTLILARIFQMLLARANGREVDTPARLISESRASSFLRRTH